MSLRGLIPLLLLTFCGCGGEPVAPASSPQSAPPATSDTAVASAAPTPSAAPTASAAAEMPSLVAPESTGTPPEPKLTASLGGKPITFTDANIVSRGGSSYEIELSTAPYTCPSGDSRSLPAGAKSMTVTITPRLEKDGSRKWLATQAYAGSFSMQADFGEAKVYGNAEKGGVVSLPAISVGQKKDEVKIEGSIKVRGCGAYLSTSITGDHSGEATVPPARPQKDLKMSIAGLAIPIQGAIVNRRQGKLTDIRLTTAARSCTTIRGDEDVEYDVDFEASKATKGYAHGKLLPINLTARFDAANPEVKVDFGAESGGQMTISLSGGADHNGYAVKLDGKVSALVCDRK